MDILNTIKKGEKLGPEYYDLSEYLLERKYLFETKADEQQMVEKMSARLENDFMSAPENFIISTTYTCNMACIYCFQSSLPSDLPKVITQDKIVKAFDFMKKIHSERGAKAAPLLTIYGGEPLQEGKKYEDAVESILDLAQQHHYGVVIITNGISLEHYANNILCDYDNIKEVHVTLDGTESEHNRRRPAKDRSNSYQNVIKGIETTLNNAIAVNMRFVADRDNIDNLTDLVDLIYEKGWNELPHFQPHMGRICCGCPGEYTHNVMTTAEIVKKLLSFYKSNERVKELIPTRCMGLDQLCKTAKPYPPIFAACPGAKIEYAMDAYGDLFPCSASMGKSAFRLGTYAPELELNENFEKWRGRNIFKDEKCTKCKSALHCGGGCPIEAHLEHGSFEDSSCRPVIETLNAGINYFYPKLKKIADNNMDSIEKEECCV